MSAPAALHIVKRTARHGPRLAHATRRVKEGEKKRGVGDVPHAPWTTREARLERQPHASGDRPAVLGVTNRRTGTAGHRFERVSRASPANR